ncbi:Uncharacterized protein GBIM_18630 [Gryllus bimaculatus]|nr:Uncharacterized protein GBIM_18630 [Gryllus bimaculatus]
MHIVGRTCSAIKTNEIAMSVVPLSPINPLLNELVLVTTEGSSARARALERIPRHGVTTWANDRFVFWQVRAGSPVDLEAVKTLLSFKAGRNNVDVAAAAAAIAAAGRAAHPLDKKRKLAAAAAAAGYDFSNQMPPLNLPTPQPSDSESEELELPLRKRACRQFASDCQLARVSVLYCPSVASRLRRFGARPPPLFFGAKDRLCPVCVAPLLRGLCVCV